MSRSAELALDQHGLLGIQEGDTFLVGIVPSFSLIHMGQCLDKLSPLSTIPQPAIRGSRRGDRTK